MANLKGWAIYICYKLCQGTHLFSSVLIRINLILTRTEVKLWIWPFSAGVSAISQLIWHCLGLTCANLQCVDMMLWREEPAADSEHPTDHFCFIFLIINPEICSLMENKPMFALSRWLALSGSWSLRTCSLAYLESFLNLSSKLTSITFVYLMQSRSRSKKKKKKNYFKSKLIGATWL